VSLRDALIDRLAQEIEGRLQAERDARDAVMQGVEFESRLQAALNENAQLRKLNAELTDTLRQLTEECQKIAG
jgi:hypothetical protein